MNWALRQRLESCPQQILLYVIADSADATGMTRHCDPDYMADHARMSRATMFRRLGELEAFGLLSRRKFFNEAGHPIYEINCHFDVLIDVPLRGRAREDGDDDAEAKSHVETPVESQSETSVGDQSLSGETAKVSLVRPHKSSSVQESPPNPPPGGLHSKREVEQADKRAANWERFKGRCTGIERMDQAKAREELDALSLDDAKWAISAIGPYQAACRRDKVLCKAAHLWLRAGMFRNFSKVAVDEGAKPAEQVWVREGTREDMALRMLRRLTAVVQPFVRTGADGSRGYFLTKPIGPDALAMLEFEAESELRWLEIEQDTKQFYAWQRRLADWTGKGRQLERPRGHGGTSPTAPLVIRVPRPWPPRRDGTWSDEATTVPEMTADDVDALANERVR